MHGKLTRFVSDKGPLAKTWTWNAAAGKPEKGTAAKFWSGSYRVEGFADVHQLARLVDSVTTHEALCTSLPKGGTEEGRISSAKRLQAGSDAGAIARTGGNFGHAAGPGLLFLDHDAAAGDGGLTREALWQVLGVACPALKSAGVVWKPSGSSHIYWDGSDLTGLRGQHLYVMMKDVADTRRAVEVLAKRLWLAGHGRGAVSKCGAFLVRGVLDKAPAGAAWLVFAGGAECAAPLTQQRGDAVVLSAGDWLDTWEALPDLTGEEEDRYQALVASAKEAKRPEMAAARAVDIERAVAEGWEALAKREGLAPEEAKQRVRESAEAARAESHKVLHVAGEYREVRQLLADFVLTCVHEGGRHERVTVGEILRDRLKYHEVRCLCPLNPEHRGGSPDARLYLLGSSPILFDLDDSGVVFQLQEAVHSVVYQEGKRGALVDGVAACLSSSGDLFLGPTGEVVEVLQHRVKPAMPGGSAVRLVPTTEADLTNLIDKKVKLVQKVPDGKGGWRDKPINAPKDVPGLVFAKLRRGDLRPLRAVISAPMPLPAMRVLDKPGYDDRSGLYLECPSERDAEVATLRARGDVRGALRIVFAPFWEYRFKAPKDSSGAVAAVFTALCRPALNKAPGVVVDAPLQGSGKSQLMASLGVLVEGEDPGVHIWPSGEDERRSSLITYTREGLRTVLFDNVTGLVKSAALAAALTSGKVTGRRLQHSESCSGVLPALIGISSNNARLDADLLRRMLWARINAGDDPKNRAFGFNPVQRTTELRQQIAEAACVVWQAYFDAGSPVIKKGDAGGFSEWNRLVRQMVLWLMQEGYTDVLPFGDLVDPASSMLADHSEADPELNAYGALLHALAEVSGGGEFTATYVHKWYEKGRTGSGAEKIIQECLDDLIPKNKEVNGRQIYNCFEDKEGWVGAGLKLRKHRDMTTRGGTMVYEVIRADVD